MNPIQQLILIIVSVCVLLILIILFVKRHEIASFFFPEKYANITMLEADNNVSTWLQKKDADLTFTFNQGVYNMFEMQEREDAKVIEQVNKSSDLKVVSPDGQVIESKEEPPVVNDIPLTRRVFTSVYRSGRLSQFFYIEGNKDPIDFRNIKSTSNPQLSKQLEKTEVMALFVGKEDFWAFVNKIAPFLIILGIIAIFVFLVMMNKNQEAAQVAQKGVEVARG